MSKIVDFRLSSTGWVLKSQTPALFKISLSLKLKKKEN